MSGTRRQEPGFGPPSPPKRGGGWGGQTLRKPDTRAGFTLIELILILTVLVVAAGVVLPGVPAFARNQRLHVGATRVAGLLRYAASWSALHSRAVDVVFDSNERRFHLELPEEQTADQLLADTSPDAEDQNLQDPPPFDEQWTRLPLPQGVEIENSDVGGTQQSGEVRLRYLPDGRGEDATLVLGIGEARCSVRQEGRRGRVLVLLGDFIQEEGSQGPGAPGNAQ